MIQAYKSIMKNWLKFNGRTSRRDYWLAYLMNIIVGAVYGAIFGAVLVIASLISEDFAAVVAIIMEIPFIIYLIWISIAFIAAAIRRFHDQGKSGMMYLWCFLGSLCCGIGGIVLIVFMCMPGVQGPNQWGPDPNGFNGGVGQMPGYGQNGMGGQPNMYGQPNNMYNQPQNNMYGNGQY